MKPKDSVGVSVCDKCDSHTSHYYLIEHDIIVCPLCAVPFFDWALRIWLSNSKKTMSIQYVNLDNIDYRN